MIVITSNYITTVYLKIQHLRIDAYHKDEEPVEMDLDLSLG